MSRLQALSDVQVILLAAQFISDVNVTSLQIIAAERTDVLTKDVIYRLLLTLYPTDYTARSALLALLKTIQSDFCDVSSIDREIDISSVTKLPPDLLTRFGEQLHLDNIRTDLTQAFKDPIAQFVVEWVHKLEANDDGIENTLPLVETFSSDSFELDLWKRTFFLPVLRLRYEFYPDASDVVGLDLLESLQGLIGIKELLKHAVQRSQKADINRDLNEVVTPWINGGYEAMEKLPNNHVSLWKTAPWSDINEWLLLVSLHDFDLAAKTLLEWLGPSFHQKQEHDEQANTDSLGYVQAAVAMIYASSNTSEAHIELSKNVLRKIVEMSRLQIPNVLTPMPNLNIPQASLNDVSEANLFHNILLDKDNKLTRVNEASLAFLSGVLQTADMLCHYKIMLAVADITKTCLSRSEDRQKQELHRILQQVPRLTSMNSDWKTVRLELLWLRSWRNISSTVSSDPPTRAYLSLIPLGYFETEILDSILAASQYDAAKELYTDADPPPLPSSVVEDRVVAAIYSAYDNASNGNRTRGGMKRAAELLTAFRSRYPQSARLKDIDYLVKATHSLSFYHLTLQHGVPFQPVSIRAHKDPLSLLGKVLEQNPKAYTKLEDLLEIGRNLVLARLQVSDSEVHRDEDLQSEIFDAEHRITFLAITSALANHDFDTAYSYITTRLSTTANQTTTNFVDDTSWRAAYSAGKYRPNSSPQSLHSRIASLSQRMDLLSLALTLAPNPEPLSEILGTWRRCEEEMDNLRSQALEEERAFEGQGSTIPGGFGLEDREQDAAETKQAMARRALAGSSATYEEAVPVGLFEVARGAATALRKSAFPLGGGNANDLKISAPSRQVSGKPEEPIPTSLDDGGRVRKRDMVSNMVTGRLVSGMSWVLGAEPAHSRQDSQ